MIPKTEGYKRPEDKLEKLKEVAVRDYKQHLDEVSSRINGAVSKTIVDGAVRDALEAGTLQRTKTSPTFRLASGVAAGLSPIGTKATSAVEKETERIRKSSGAYKVGKVAGEIGSFTIPYVGAAEKVGAAVMKLPAVAKMGKTGQRIAKSVATDLAVGVPLNTNYAVNKEGLRGKEAAKSVAINTGVDLALGGVTEAVTPHVKKFIDDQAAKAYLEHLENERINKEKAEFMSQVYEWWRGEMPTDKVIKVCETPEILKKYGALDGPITMTQKVLQKIVYPSGYKIGNKKVIAHGHNMGYKAIEMLPKQLNNPLAISRYIDSDGGECRTILTELADDHNRTVIIGLCIDSNGHIKDENRVTTYYGMKDFKAYINRLKEERTLLYEKEKGPLPAPNTRLKLARRVADSDPIFILSSGKENVKGRLYPTPTELWLNSRLEPRNSLEEFNKLGETIQPFVPQTVKYNSKFLPVKEKIKEQMEALGFKKHKKEGEQSKGDSK